MKYNNLIQDSGQAASPIILLIGGIITEIAIAGVFDSFYLRAPGWESDYPPRPLAAAKAGTEDADKNNGGQGLF